MHFKWILFYILGGWFTVYAAVLKYEPDIETTESAHKTSAIISSFWQSWCHIYSENNHLIIEYKTKSFLMGIFALHNPP